MVKHRWRGCAINPNIVQTSRNNIIFKWFRDLSDYFREVSAYFRDVSADFREVDAFFRLETSFQNFETSFNKFGAIMATGGVQWCSSMTPSISLQRNSSFRPWIFLFRDTFDHDQGQESAISGRRLEWILDFLQWIFSLLSRFLITLVRKSRQHLEKIAQLPGGEKDVEPSVPPQSFFCLPKNHTISRLLPLRFWSSEGHFAQCDLILTKAWPISTYFASRTWPIFTDFELYFVSPQSSESKCQVRVVRGSSE